MATLFRLLAKGRGKSEHRRAGCLLTGGVRKGLESATESKPPKVLLHRRILARVKGWCKRPPVPGVNRDACKPHLVQARVILKLWSAAFERRVGRVNPTVTPGPDKWSHSSEFTEWTEFGL